MGLNLRWVRVRGGGVLAEAKRCLCSAQALQMQETSLSPGTQEGLLGTGKSERKSLTSLTSV